MLSICCDELIICNSEENVYVCSCCLRIIQQEELYPCDEDDFDYRKEYPLNDCQPDLGGTGHGDISYSDADPGL